ncbi:hypothetical protein F4776DRAFT_631932 [Hypoxylon sp. NC0597]|nr:hypothetical protein F4776DRAFT_631932 [Hypoxylon sp. NC0597]
MEHTTPTAKVHSITRYSIGLLTLVSLMLFVSLMRNGTFGVHMHIQGLVGALQMRAYQWGVFRLGVDGS